MKPYLPALLAFLVSSNLNANELFAGADIRSGERLVQQHCISCHASSFGGDGSEIYTREFRKITTASGLLTQVRNCSTTLNLSWFEDEELNAAAYLNKTYYHFQ